MKIEEKIQSLMDYYYERYHENSPYFGADECHLLVEDGVSKVGLISFASGRLTVEWSDKSYSVSALLKVGVKFFEKHSTDWGVYRTQF